MKTKAEIRLSPRSLEIQQIGKKTQGYILWNTSLSFILKQKENRAVLLL